MYNPFTRKNVSLENVFDAINLTEYEIQDKVQKLFDDSQDNDYLEDSIDKLEKDYKLEMFTAGPNGEYMKRLIKK